MKDLRFSTIALAATVIALTTIAAQTAFSAEPAGKLRLATFRCDATPPLGGHPLIWTDPPTSVEDPLWAKGIVIDDGQRRYVLCAVDWCGLCNSSYRLFQDRLAKAAGTEGQSVALQCIHQHTAPYTDGDAQRLLNGLEKPPKYVDQQFLEQLSDRLADAVRESLSRLEPFDQVGIGQGKVEHVAATRRVRWPDGKIHVRYSSCRDPALRAMPEGDIDPWLKTITLARAGKPLVRIHYYAVHPQSFYGGGRVSADFVGHARDALEQKEGVFGIYFTGCAGDMTAGKYNDGTPEARRELTRQLTAGMNVAVADTRLVPVQSIQWRSLDVILPVRDDPPYDEATLRARMADTKLSDAVRARAACGVATAERANQPFGLRAITLGPATLLHLPGESLMAYQKYAQSLLPDRFVAVAAYGDVGTGYICPEAAYAEGGYEPTASHLAPHGEKTYKQAIRQVLGVGGE